MKLAVPNNRLMNNHQVEIAEILEKHNYLVHSSCSSLKDKISEAINFRPRKFPKKETEDFERELKKIYQ